MPEPDHDPDRQAALAIELMDEHGASLAEEAREVLAQHPDVRLVGLILTPDSEEMRVMRPRLERETRESLTGKGFVGLMPREFALAILRQRAPATLDWIEPHETGRLPLMAATRDGYRFG